MNLARVPHSVEEHIAALAACESIAALTARLAHFLQSVQSVPAILYLRQGEQLHPLAGFDCSREVPALPVSSLPNNERSGELPANQVILTLRGEVVGLLAVFGRVMAASEQLQRCATILAMQLRHLSHQEALKRELHLANEQLAHLVNAGQLLGERDIDVLLRRILETILGAVRVPVGAVAVRDQAHPERPRLATWGMRDSAVLRLRLRDGQQLVDAAMRHGQVMHLAREELRSRLHEPPAQLGGLLVLPLGARGHVHGAVVLAGPEEVTSPQRRLAESLAGFAGAALENALQVGALVEAERISQELAIARSVQEAMYPVRGIAEALVQIEGSSRSCHETGGDYFTFLSGPHALTALIADVSGHGLGAALFATMAHAIIQHRLHQGEGILAASAALNQGLCHAQSGRFLTCAMVEIEPTTRALRYVSAGHCPLLWIHRGQVRWLESTSVPLGIMPQAEPELAQPGTLAPGDLLVLYTDGVTEAANPQHEPFGDERLAQAVLQAWRLELAPAEVMMLVHAEVDAWTGGAPQEDDLTMVVVRSSRREAAPAPV